MTLTTNKENIKAAALLSRMTVAFREKNEGELHSGSLCSTMQCGGVTRLDMAVYAPDVASCAAHLYDQFLHVLKVSVTDTYVLAVATPDDTSPNHDTLTKELSRCYGDRFLYSKEDLKQGIIAATPVTY